jgi:hypothetical protein
MDDASPTQPQQRQDVPRPIGSGLGCLTAAGAGMLFVGFWAWLMRWGFAGPERHFGARFYFQASDSSAWVNTPDLDGIAQYFALWSLAAGCLIAIPVLLKKRSFSLQRLIASCVLAGLIGVLPLACERFEPTTGGVELVFAAPLTPEQVAEMRERLRPAAVSQWQPPATLGVTPPTAAELARMLHGPHSDVQVNDGGGSFFVEFPSGMGFRRRTEITQFIIAYVESLATEFAVQAGLAPIKPGDRVIEHRVFEK